MKSLSIFSRVKKQAGLTLIELIASLAILALVIGGALSLYGSASTSQSTTQTIAELSSIRAATKQMYYGQGGYGTTNLNNILVASGKVPSTINVVVGAPATLTNSFSGAITLTGATNSFTMAVTNVPQAVCVGILASASSNYTSVQVGAAAAVTAFPISPAVATAQCTGTTQTVTFTSA